MAHSKFDRLIKTIVAVSFLGTAAVLVSPHATAAVEGSKETSAKWTGPLARSTSAELWRGNHRRGSSMRSPRARPPAGVSK